MSGNDGKRVNNVVRDVGALSGKLESLEDNFKTHRKEIRDDIKDGFKTLNSTLNSKINEISGNFDKRITSCSTHHDSQLRDAHGRMKGQDERIAVVERNQGKLTNWKHWVVGIAGGIIFLLITLPPAIKMLLELFGG